MIFTCPTCGRISHNPGDSVHRYCGVCGFADGKPSARTFTCVDCASIVYSFEYAPNVTPQCSVCKWIANNIQDPADRELVRAFINKGDKP